MADSTVAVSSPSLSLSLLRIVQVTALLAFVVVMVGAYVRLSHAGLGCPDWPGCYGELAVPSDSATVQRAQNLFPERLLEPAKAWKEMVHRYLAGALGLLIFWIAFQALRQPGGLAGRFRALPVGIAVLVVAQALLGMWTVTWKLQPLVVVAHLLGGMATLGLLWWLAFRLRDAGTVPDAHDRARALVLAWVGLGLLVGQIALGGWTSSNYAVYACPDFPTCQGVYWPTMDFEEGFRLWRELGVNYEGGVLDAPARTAIHIMHRLGALLVTGVLLAVAMLAFLRGRGTRLRRSGGLVAALILAQFTLGVTIAVFTLPLPAAVAHNGVAAALLVALVYHMHVLYAPPR